MKNLDADVMSSFDYYRICKNVIDSRVRNFPFLNSNSVIVQAKAKSYETPAPVAIFIFEKVDHLHYVNYIRHPNRNDFDSYLSQVKGQHLLCRCACL